MFIGILLLFNIIFLCAALYFMIESFHEKEPRAPYVGLAGVLFHMILIPLIIWVPVLEVYITILFCIYLLAFLVCLIPGKPNPRALKGSTGYKVEDIKRFDERDTVFARVEGLQQHPESKQFEEYYNNHPEFKEYDEKRKDGGFPVGPPGKIDDYYPPTKAMVEANWHMCEIMGDHFNAKPSPEAADFKISPEKSTEIVKNFALHTGADLVGVCKVDHQWAYTHRGEIPFGPDEFGKELLEPLPFGLVFAVEMGHEHVSTAPHTPSVAESISQYCKGEYISTILVHWFSLMGYEARAHHFLHYDHIMVPLAVDAGLGELGRQGYLIAPKYGCRVRVFGVTTDMPLVPDKPISIGADEFCEKCKKCATSCPSNAIPLDEKTVHNGIEKWKLDDESCYTFWGKVGTDCAICMSICPFSRPDRPIHRLVRWIVARSPVAKTVFPYIDNFIYGKKWRPKKLAPWLDYNPDTKESF